MIEIKSRTETFNTIEREIYDIVGSEYAIEQLDSTVIWIGVIDNRERQHVHDRLVTAREQLKAHGFRMRVYRYIGEERINFMKVYTTKRAAS